MIHRREIDGLRAIAVLPVILNHARFPGFAGGFVGVDIFFVISGFLITTLIKTDIYGGNFSILKFYERRFRRLLPAFVFVAICCLPFAWLWMLPKEIQDFGNNMSSAAIFLSNGFLASQTDYFSGAANLKPFLHTWSLSLEEQFYLVFPLLLVGLWKIKKHAGLYMIILAIVVSFAFGVAEFIDNPETAYFSTMGRSWELLVGAAAAVISLRFKPNHNATLGMFGLLIIALSIFGMNESKTFPSIQIAFSVLGTAVVLVYARGESAPAKLLSNRLLVGIGIVSYSAYLWHQPLLAFHALRLQGHASLYSSTIVILIVFSLAYLTWRFVEQPFRSGMGGSKSQFLQTRRALFTSAALSLGFVFAAGQTLVVFSHSTYRLPESVINLAAAETNKTSSMGCHMQEGDSMFDSLAMKCRNASGKRHIDALIMGDSHANAIAAETKRALDEKGLGVASITYSSCLPFEGFTRQDKPAAYDCNGYVKRIKSLARSNNIKTIILATRYSYYLLGTQFDNGEGGIEKGRSVVLGLEDSPHGNGRISKSEKMERLKQAIRFGIMDLAREFNVVLVYPIPEVGFNVPQVTAREKLYNHTDLNITTSYDQYLRRHSEIMPVLDSISARNIVRIKPQEYICDAVKGRCRTSAQGKIIYFDDDHLNNAGASILAEPIAQAVISLQHTAHSER